MGKNNGSKKKDPFAALPDDFKDGIEGMGQEELKAKFVEVTKSELENIAAAKADQDLLIARDRARVAAQVYTDQSKMNRLKTKYLVQAMADKGDSKSEQIVRLELSAAK